MIIVYYKQCREIILTLLFYFVGKGEFRYEVLAEIQVA